MKITSSLQLLSLRTAFHMGLQACSCNARKAASSGRDARDDGRCFTHHNRVTTHRCRDGLGRGCGAPALAVTLLGYNAVRLAHARSHRTRLHGSMSAKQEPGSGHWERRAHQAAVSGPWIGTTPERAGWSELSSKEFFANLAVLKLPNVLTARDAGAAAALSSELEHARRRRAPSSAM